MNLYTNQIEDNYSKHHDIKYRRSSGQFFTPFKIAQFMSEWILNHPKKKLKILDPAAGFGIFERALEYENKNNYKNLTVDLWEIDSAISNELSKIVQRLDIDARIFNADFLNGAWNELYDGIIANPPYYKHHHIKNKNEVYQKICLKASFRFSVQTNIYCWFLIKSLNLLNVGGRLAFIVPSEFLNANYGEKVKDYLRQSGLMIHLINIHFQENVFENALTTSVIILGEKGPRKYDTVNFYNVLDIDELSSLKDFLKSSLPKSITVSSLNPKYKWRNYFNGYEEEGITHKLIPFSKLGRFSRGIATGANQYFTLSEKEAKMYEIPNECLIPCITKATQVKDIYFTQVDFKHLQRANKKIYLFNGGNSATENCRGYIKRGEIIGINKRYLTRNRTPWYAIEKREVSKIWIPVFGRKGLKFIWNDSRCLTLTCFHVFYPTKLGEKYIDIFFLYLNTDFAKEFIEREKREYGNGLEKFEPNDINKSYTINFDLLAESQVEELKEMQRIFLLSGHKQRNVLLNKANEYFKKVLQSETAEPTHQFSLFRL